MDKRTYFQQIETYRLMAKHEVGQNFLIDDEAAERIVESLGIEEGERVLEIGSGAGSLTYFLAQSSGKVDAIDIDEALVLKLQGELGDKVNVQLGNAARYDYAGYEKIIGNLPYYITSKIIERCLLLGTDAKAMVFMVQKEAGERLLADVGTGDYGPLPILIKLLSSAKKAFTVRRNCFAPAPHVDSIVLTFAMKPRPIHAKKAYELACSLFLQRRKTLLNNLKNYLHDVEKAEQLLSALGLSKTIRPEQVTPEQYLALAEAIAAK